MKKIITVLLVAFFLASCAPAVKVIPTETAIPTSAFTSIPPTSTITPSSTAQPLLCDLINTSSLETSADMDIFNANQNLRRTINLGEAFEFPDQGHWGWIDKEEIFYMVKTAGFTAVRIAIDFAVNSDGSSSMNVYPLFWSHVDSVIDKAIACGLTVIVNMHNYNAESQIPNAQEGDFLSLWEQIAEHYKNYPDNVLYFELYNEPADPQQWNRLVDKGISTIRQSNPTRPIIIPSAYWSDIAGLSELRLPSDPNLIVSYHYYSPLEFTHQCVDFIDGGMEWCGTPWNGTADETALINLDFDRVSEWANKRRHPIFLGEFGSISIADPESRVRWTAAVREAAEARGFSWGYWDLCDTSVYDDSLTFGIFDCNKHPLSTFNWRQDMLQALIPEP